MRALAAPVVGLLKLFVALPLNDTTSEVPHPAAAEQVQQLNGIR
jgi:hypothetical protein